jgi:hypothetical protein
MAAGAVTRAAAPVGNEPAQPLRSVPFGERVVPVPRPWASSPPDLPEQKDAPHKVIRLPQIIDRHPAAAPASLLHPEVAGPRPLTPSPRCCGVPPRWPAQRPPGSAARQACVLSGRRQRHRVLGHDVELHLPGRGVVVVTRRLTHGSGVIIVGAVRPQLSPQLGASSLEQPPDARPDQAGGVHRPRPRHAAGGSSSRLHPTSLAFFAAPAGSSQRSGPASPSQPAGPACRPAPLARTPADGPPVILWHGQRRRWGAGRPAPALACDHRPHSPW